MVKALPVLKSAARKGLASLNHEQAVAALLFFLAALLVSADIAPTFDQIANWDESAYIASGRELVDEGKLRVFAWSPLAMALYGLAYLPFQDSPQWFVNTAAGGRVVIFVLFWLAVYLCGRSMSRVAPSVNLNAVMMMAAVWVTLIPFLGNASDALFMAMSGLALWSVLEYRSSSSLKRLALASVLVGLGACARNDGIVLFVSFLLLTAWFTSWGREGRVGRALGVAAAAGLPFLMIVGGYILAYGLTTGEFELGTEARTYGAFEDGHRRSYPWLYPGGDGELKRRADVQEIYGTPAENEHSIFNAIRRNPGAFLSRTARQLRALPGGLDATYGGVGVILLFLVARGVVSLWKSGRGWLLGMAVIWHLHLSVYVLMFWHPRYLQFPFIFLMVIGSIGAVAVISNFGDRRERAAVLAALAAATVIGILFDGPSGAVPLVLFAGAACYALALRFAPALLAAGLFRPLLIVALCVAVVTVSHIGSRSRLPASPGPSPAAQALQYLIETAQEGSVVAAYGQKVPYAARMMQRNLPPSQDALLDLESWLEANDIRAVYLDPTYKAYSPDAWRTLLENTGPGKALFAGYSDPESDTYVLLPAEPGREG